MLARFLFALTTIVVLSACSNGFFYSARAEAAINEGMKTVAPCQPVALGTLGRSGSPNTKAPALLVAKGYAQEATVAVHNFLGQKTKDAQGFVLTEKGQTLVVKAETPWDYPCIRYGNWQIRSIEAIDGGTDASGKTIANVRATIRFVEEDWLQPTRNSQDPSWVRLWENIRKTESKQWMYQLIRSGDAFFFTGPGKAVN